ncbi:MAG: contractile injection system protein, VgrG/Pvc8 family [Myxococcota bacterium]|nr:contractile injection system protein, VgrG/Pvc8 family [Myxococcota bacterium]
MGISIQGSPSYKITVGTLSFTDEENQIVRSIVVEDHVDMAGFCQIMFDASTDQGKVEVKIGDPVDVQLKTTELSVFKGEVISVDHSFQNTGTTTKIIRCIDHIHRLNRGRKTRFWNDKKDSDVASEVGGECGLSVESDPTQETHPYIIQRNESNVAFLKRLAARNNFQLRVEQDKLYFKEASFNATAVDLEVGDDILSLNMSYNSSNMVQKVIVQGWSIKDKKEIIGQSAAGEVTKIGGGKIGAEQASVFGESVAYITDVPVSSQEVANKIAKAEMERIARQYANGKCVVRGENTIRAGSVVNFKGFVKGLNGKFYVISSRHLINPSTGYTTEFKFCSNTEAENE